MSATKIPRPSQVTLCGAAILAGSVFLVLLAFDHMAGLGSIEAQEASADFVSTPPGEGLGLTADQHQTLLRVLCLVVGGAAVAAAILGWQALQRQRSARVVLSALAPVLLVAGSAAGNPIASVAAVVAVAVALLWVQPGRDWFAGVTPQRPARVPAGPDPASYPPPPPGTTLTQAPPTAPPRSRPAPASVRTAVRLTIVCSAVVAVSSLYALLVSLNDRSRLESEVADELAGQEMYDGIDASLVVDVVVVGVGFFVVWALAAIVLAVLTLRGSDGARVALVVSAFGAAAASLIGIALVVPLLVGGVCIAVGVLLLRSEAGTWFSERNQRS